MKDSQRIIALLEKMTGHKVILREADEAMKNMSVEALNNVTEALDMLKQHVEMAIEKVRNLPNQDVANTKLKGLSTIIDSSLTDVAEIIAGITGISTEEDMLSEGMGDEAGVEMDTDQAIKDINSVKKFAQNGVNIKLSDK